MRRIPVLLVAAAVAAAVTVGVGPAEAASGSLTVTTLGRDGSKVATTLSIVKADGSAYWRVAGNKARSLAKGKYIVLTDIWNAADGTDTIAGRVVTVTGKNSFTIDARKGRALVTALDVPAGYHQTYDDVRICAGSSSYGSIDAYGAAGRVYILGDPSKLLQLAYVTSWKSDTEPGAESYAISAATKGLPARPTWVYKRAALGTVRMNAMRGPAGSPQTLLELQPQARTCQGDLWTNVEQDVTPLSRTVHVSPGSWSVRADTFADENGQSDDIGSYNTVLAVKAGKSYLRTFYRSAWGPANYGPYVAGKSVWFDTSEMFTDPAESNEFGGEGSEKSTVTLTLKKKVLVTRTRTDWGGTAATFSYRLKSAGWYTLSVNARRYRPGYHYPADMLSPQSSVVFHFHADPRKQGNVPVYLTRFVPAGVSNTNSVKPGTTTAVTLKLQRPIWSNDLGHPAVKMKTLTAWASSDNGKTWHVATVRRSGNNWVALVRSPASGTISLRARVTDPTGVSCETTVYRAYAVQ